MLNSHQSNSVNIHRIQLITERDAYKAQLEYSLNTLGYERVKYRIIIAILVTLIVTLFGSLLYVIN